MCHNWIQQLYNPPTYAGQQARHAPGGAGVLAVNGGRHGVAVQVKFEKAGFETGFFTL
jgi:hypothetical protein